MSPAAALPRFSIYQRFLRLSLALGAAFDFVLAALLFGAPDLLVKLLALPPPGEDFCLWLLAILLAILGAFYLLAAYDPVAYSGNVAVAIAGRTAAGTALVLAAARRPDLAGLYPLAAADLLFAAIHAVLWWPVRRTISRSSR